ncbi:MAG: hypothetical protein COA79_02325 [Planctomycetota bacterium]|nr:MAG: hypothetical protein COA79_02325 [Planctomycetota bacterium]
MEAINQIKTSEKKSIHFGLDLNGGQLKLFTSPLGSFLNGRRLSFTVEQFEDLDAKLESTGNFLQKNRDSLPKKFEVTPCLSFTDVLIRSLRIPKTSPKEIMNILKWELSETIEFSLETHQLRYIYIGEMKERQGTRDEYLVFLTANSVIQKYTDFFEQYNIKAFGLDFEGLAITRFLKNYSEIASLTHESVGIINIGQSTSSFQILRNNQLAFMKSIKYGSKDFDTFYGDLLNFNSEETKKWRIVIEQSEKISQETIGFIEQSQVKATEPLKNFISSCMRYFSGSFRGEYVQQIFITGDLSNFQGLTQTLSESTGASITKPTLPNIDYDLSTWAQVIGQSLKQRANL